MSFELHPTEINVVGAQHLGKVSTQFSRLICRMPRPYTLIHTWHNSKLKTQTGNCNIF